MNRRASGTDSSRWKGFCGPEDAIDLSDFGGIKKKVCKMDANTFNSLLIPFRIGFWMFLDFTCHAASCRVTHMQKHYMIYIYMTYTVFL